MRRRAPFAVLMLMLAAIAGTVIAFGGSFSPSSWDDPVEQWANIKFSHKLHIEQLGDDCTVCHAAAANSEKSGDLLLPLQADCGGCHDIQGDCKFCHLNADKLEAYAAPKREVIFSHKLHLEKQQLECSACHAGIEQAEKPSVAYLPTMASCNSCHDQVKANNTCEACHSQVELLLPLSHRQADWAREHKRLIRAQGMTNDCAMCHSDNYCQVCHAEATTQVTRGDRVRSVAQNRPAPEGRQPLVKQKVHDLNFVFTHGIASRSKQSDCYSCHNQQTFCTDCHARQQDAGFASPVPLSHRAPDFVRLGVGTGGGQHAVLARRELESCASCHDLEGRDPACLTCHVDRLPGKGNDPKTHPADFRNEHGDWHSNAGSLCYNCHTNTQRAGIGFCGYCHGMK